MEKTKFGYFKWYTDKAETLESHLTNEQMGEFFFAVMSYVKHGIKREVSPELELLYYTYCDDADRAKQSYNKKCAVLRENGSKGGKAKAANGKIEEHQAKSKFKPPTKKEFLISVQHFLEHDEIDCEEYDAQAFYDELSESGWKIGCRAITTRKEWESALRWKFPSAPYVNCFTDWYVFKTIFEQLPCLDTGYFSNFFDDNIFNSKAQTWTINGKQHTNVRSALNAYIDDITKKSEEDRNKTVYQ